MPRGVYAREPQIEDLARIARSLNECGARYLLIGGFAVIAHGGARTTKDIGLLIDPSPDNIGRVRQALRILEDHAVDDVKDDDVALHVEGIPIPVASLRTLIRTKNTPRPLDAADRAYLQALLDSER